MLWARLQDWWEGRRGTALTDQEVEALRRDFQERYHHFRLLLAANNQALDLMSQMEGALGGGRVFGQSFVRSRCTALGVAVFAMARHLDSLAPGKYQALFARHRAIASQVEEVLARRSPPPSGELVLPLSALGAAQADLAGGKMANLGEVGGRLGLPTPPGFVITAAAFQRFFAHNGLTEEIARRVQAAELGSTDQLFALSSSLKQLISAAGLPEDLAAAIGAAYAELEALAGAGVTVALRSSAVGEDAAESSFAGQYSSQLNVAAEHILDSYKEVVASKYSPQAMHYRYVRGLKDEDLPMAVGCLAMVPAAAGGVAYTVSPLDPADRRVHISACWGLPKGVVDGNAPADLFVVSRGDPPRLEHSRVAHKAERYDCYPEEGVCRLSLAGEAADRPCLEPDQAEALAAMALRLEAHYGAPQDVEWALDHRGSFLFLQSRPLKPPESMVRPAGSAPAEGVLASGGVGVSRGAAAGPVFWVRKDSDALRFPPGAVLAVAQPWPRWAALLGAAAALVSPAGGLAGHLATVAREYGVPAVFALGEAAGALTDGEMVTVDADAGRVLSGRVEELLNRRPPTPDLLAGSPVQQTLREVLAHVTPLTLIDPDSPQFQAESCATWHDITRFCHEMSVREMFSFGAEHRFPERSSKQLFHEVPMQYWVLNLDDGFTREVIGRYVRLDEVACGPMLALWEGIVAVPWDGPPRLSGRGFAAVMFEATANPALSSPFKTPYANKNYFMISRQFMNLQSRFGFHFSTVEALVGPRARDNYASFSFAGGAADANRKAARAQFICELLEERGYVCEVREDKVRARLEGLAEEVMLARLKELGYLIMHTRQLDMIMADPDAVARYRAKMTSDLASLRPSASSLTPAVP